MLNITMINISLKLISRLNNITIKILIEYWVGMDMFILKLYGSKVSLAAAISLTQTWEEGTSNEELHSSD